MSSGTERIAQGLRSRSLPLLQELVEQYQHRLVRYMIYLLGKQQGIQDLVQETWLRVLERGSTYNGLQRFEPWLFAIAHNVAINDTRQRRTANLAFHQDLECEAALDRQLSRAPSPFAVAAQTEDAQRLALSLETLEPACREALLLRFQEELSLQEISSVVGAPVSTVSTRIYRSLAKLREQLEVTNHGI